MAFYGSHQAGITTDVQDRLAFAAFDVTATRREDLVDMLKTWTAAAEAMSRGVMVPGDSHAGAVPPADTGEAGGLSVFFELSTASRLMPVSFRS